MNNEDIKLINGDCLVEMKNIPDKSIDLIVTDPPYWHKKSPGKPYSQRKQCNAKGSFGKSELYNFDCAMMKNMSDFNEQSINLIMTEFERLCKIMNCYIFCNETQVPYYSMWAEQNGYMFSILVWRKPLSIINKNRFSQNVEFIVRVYDYGTALNKLNTNYFYDRVKDVKPLSGKSKIHPVQKPVELISQFVELSSKEKGLILDPFMGSGSTAIACLNTNRMFIGIEMDESYFSIAKDRILKEQSNKQLNLF